MTVSLAVESTHVVVCRGRIVLKMSSTATTSSRERGALLRPIRAMTVSRAAGARCTGEGGGWKVGVFAGFATLKTGRLDVDGAAATWPHTIASVRAAPRSIAVKTEDEKDESKGEEILANFGHLPVSTNSISESFRNPVTLLPLGALSAERPVRGGLGERSDEMESFPCVLERAAIHPRFVPSVERKMREGEKYRK